MAPHVVIEKVRDRKDGDKIEWKSSEVNTKAVSREQNELLGKFKMAADVISIRGQVMKYTYIPAGISLVHANIFFPCCFSKRQICGCDTRAACSGCL